MTSAAPAASGDGTALFTAAETEAIRPGSTRPWNPGAAQHYLTGVGEGGWHAVPRSAARAARRRGWVPGRPLEVLAVCGTRVAVAVGRGTYDRVGLAVEQRPCRACAWQLAIETGSTGRELTFIIPAAARAAAIARGGADPMLAARVCEAVLTSAHHGGDDDGGLGELGSPAVTQVLALAAAHRPVLYLPEACAEDECEARPPGACGYSCATVGCGTCTPGAGQWAGQWAGDPLAGLIIPAPCSVLTTLAARFDVAVR